MKGDWFSVPLLNRPCPAGVPAEVWTAFVQATNYKTTEERTEKWLYYLSVHAKYYDQAGNKKPTVSNNDTAQANLF